MIPMQLVLWLLRKREGVKGVRFLFEITNCRIYCCPHTILIIEQIVESIENHMFVASLK